MKRTLILVVIFAVLAIGPSIAVAILARPVQAQTDPTPTPWPIPEIPGVADIEPSVSRFDTNLGTKLYIIEGTTAKGTPFICSVYVQYDVDQMDCQFPSLNQYSTFLPTMER